MKTRGPREQTATPWVSSIRLLWPLLLIYLAIVAGHLVLAGSTLGGDESRYVGFAENLSRGYYTRSDPGSLNLWNGPGYPILLAPLAWLGLPWTLGRFMNPVLLFASVVLLHRTLSLYVSGRAAWISAVAFGLYWPAWVYLPRLLTESLTIFLLSAFGYLFCKHAASGRVLSHRLILAGVVLGWLALTKAIFGYVLLVLVLGGSVAWAWRRRETWLSAVVASVVALVVCLPYLTYTWSLTDRVFYWSTAGGLSLYWMSTPFEGEFGDWHSPADVKRNPKLAENHGVLFDSIHGLGQVEADRALMRRARENIAQQPGKYSRNVAANVGRMLFSYPYSYAEDRLTTYFWMIPNMFFVVVATLVALPAWRRRSSIPGEYWVLLLFGAAAFAGSMLLSAYSRQFVVLIPILGLWLAYVLGKVVRCETSG